MFLRKRIISLALAIVVSFVAGALPEVGLAMAARTEVPGKPASLGYLPQGHLPLTFKFILTTDSHFGSGQGNRNSSWALKDIAERHRDAAFLIHMGDITETGRREEYTMFKDSTATFPYPVMATLGNHESRWQDPHGAVFVQEFGPSTYSFDYGGWHFVVLDSTYPEQGYGTLDPYLLSWLEKDLSAQPKGKPIAVFSHHPILYEARDFQDSDDAFLSFLDRYPIQVVFSGHGHSFISWKVQGRDFFMIGALMDGSYAVIKADPSKMDIYSVTKKEDNGTVTTQETLLGQVTVKRLEEFENPVTAFSANVHQGILTGKYELRERAALAFQIDGGYYNDLGEMLPGSHEFTVDVSKHARGIHTLRLKADGPDGVYFKTLEFGKDESGMILWKKELGSAVSGRMLLKSPTEAILGTRDGRIFCVRIPDGEVLWTFDAVSAWGGGALDGNRLYFGTAKGDLFCLDATRGTLVWRTSLDPAGFSEPPAIYASTHGKLLYIGSASGKLFAVNPFTAERKWIYEAKGSINCTPAAGNDMIFFGAWDGKLYAVKAATGEQVWSINLGRQVYYSPSGNPVFYRNTVFTFTPLDNHGGGSFLYAIHPSTGAEIWKAVTWRSFIEPSLPCTSTGQAQARPFILAPDSGGRITGIYADTGEIAWHIQGSSTLFSGISNLDSVYVTGGSRGVLNIFTGQSQVDYKVRDTFLFQSPLLTTVPTGNGTGQRQYVVLQGDSRGTLWAIILPTQ
ncbi:MAG: PQQ-binding-like beta-propeller repeat protein [Candidatus Fermentithermobacillus carboniphilus]|uniref:PQQ-binding-like beta-propeller repeat protein n=1 Tax=Candidatus Fermentithermobacillus carboniphilus TaxID=3085328 RepID=A0AAT9LCJ3_9FIRM|nr:MAG: PQQ-binding-like beta-propeller repeat protein [Candidatus Fermentithermobacillus carboniphilus]